METTDICVRIYVTIWFTQLLSIYMLHAAMCLMSHEAAKFRLAMQCCNQYAIQYM